MVTFDVTDAAETRGGRGVSSKGVKRPASRDVLRYFFTGGDGGVCKLARASSRGLGDAVSTRASYLPVASIRAPCLLACLPPALLCLPGGRYHHHHHRQHQHQHQHHDHPSSPLRHVLLVRYTIPVYSTPLVRFVSPRQGERARNREATLSSVPPPSSHSPSSPPPLVPLTRRSYHARCEICRSHRYPRRERLRKAFSLECEEIVRRFCLKIIQYV